MGRIRDEGEVYPRDSYSRDSYSRLPGDGHSIVRDPPQHKPGAGIQNFSTEAQDEQKIKTRKASTNRYAGGKVCRDLSTKNQTLYFIRDRSGSQIELKIIDHARRDMRVSWTTSNAPGCSI